MKIFNYIKRSIVLNLALLLLYNMQANAQDAFTGIPEQFKKYSNSTQQEKLYVHTDKNFYLAGELLWFKVYNVDGAAYQPVDLSKIAYLEILDKENKPVMQAKIALRKGKGNGSFYLPVSINSGNYTLRAYTNWMKNLPATCYFEKPVTIVNTPTGINDKIINDRETADGSGTIELFPNPADEKFTLRLRNISNRNIRLFITSITGVQVKSSEMEIPDGSCEQEIDVSDLSSGLYFVMIKSGGKKFLGKLVIQ
jgi:hypothetical protein